MSHSNIVEALPEVFDSNIISKGSSNFLLMLFIAGQALCNAMTEAQIYEATFVSQESKKYSSILEENQQILKDDASKVDPNKPDTQDKYNTDLQQCQNKANVTSNFLSDLEGAISRIASSVQQNVAILKETLGSVFDFSNNLLARG